MTQEILNKICQSAQNTKNLLSKPVALYIDDTVIYSSAFEAHLAHLRRVLDRLIQVGLKLKPQKCHFLCPEVDFLGYLITPQGIHPNPQKVAAVREYPVPKSVKEVRQFVGFASYYRRLVRGFSRVAQPLHALTRKGVVFAWTQQCQEAFDALKSLLVEAPILVHPDFDKPFVLETDASAQGLGAVLSQVQDDKRLHPIAYASRALSPQEKKYAITELETLAVVWAVQHYHAYLYGHEVTVYTDHSAVKAVLETPSPSGKHARWWSKVFASGVQKLEIIYRAGKENANADALSRAPWGESPSEALVTEVQVASIHSASDLLSLEPATVPAKPNESFAEQQRKDTDILELVSYLTSETLPDCPLKAKKIAAKAPLYTLINGILYFLDSKREGRRRCVVPKHLRRSIIEENHQGPLAGHFSGERLYKALARHWWWQNMYGDVVSHCASCPQCAIVNSSGRVNRPPLHPIPVQRVFQIVGVDVMDLPKTERGNKYVVVFQDFLSKWPLVFPVPDQKAQRLARLLVEEVVPFFGVPEALLSDRGTNLLSHLMQDVCKLMGIQKLNTTAYHPQCDGMVERFNRTLKTILRKHAATFGSQWDQYLPGVLWAYRNTPHESTGEKPSYLLFGVDCRTPTEAAYIPPSSLHPTDVTEYKEELCLSLSVARELAAKNIQKAQARYKKHYDKARGAKPASLKTGEWVLVRFPQDEQGRNRKLSRPWHGPYRVVSRQDPDVCVGKVYFPQDPQIRVHESRVKHCPANFPAGFYWYGGKRRGPGRPPKWVTTLLDTMESQDAEGDSVDLSEDGADVSQESTDQDPDDCESSVEGDDGPDDCESSVDGDDGPADCESSVDGDDGPDESLADLFQLVPDPPVPAAAQGNSRYPLRNRQGRSGRTL